VVIDHGVCAHFYHAKENGKKEQRYLETEGGDLGSCSVCWKLKKSPASDRPEAQTFVDEYQLRFETAPERLTYYLIELERVYYKWLYFDPSERRTRYNHDQPDQGRDASRQRAHEAHQRGRARSERSDFHRGDFHRSRPARAPPTDGYVPDLEGDDFPALGAS